MSSLSDDLRTEARRARAFKFRLDAMMRELPEGTTLSILEQVRINAHQAETILGLEAFHLDRYAALS